MILKLELKLEYNVASNERELDNFPVVKCPLVFQNFVQEKLHIFSVNFHVTKG